MVVIQIGVYPPPVGGTTIHNARLTKFCAEQGIHTVFLDPYGQDQERGRGELQPPLYRFDGSLVQRFWQLRRLIKEHPQAVVHVHVSAFGTFALVGYPFLALLKGYPRILSIQAGNFIEAVETSAYWRQLLIQRLIRGFDAIVVTQPRHAEYLTHTHRIGGNRVHIIPSFIPLVPVADESCQQVLNQILNCRERFGPLVLVTGQLLDFYGLETFLEALMRVRNHGTSCGLVLALYQGAKPPDEKLEQHVYECVNALGNGLVLRNLTEDVFVRLLKECQVFVRPTTMEGDSNALREAAAAGLQIIASDCAPRPTGAALFHTGNAEALAQEIEYCLAKPAHGCVQESIAGNGERFLELYQKLWTTRYGLT